jgi:hypothetical protein
VALERKWRRQARRLAERRANLDQSGFVALLADSADADVAEWLWNELLVYWRPTLTPHPDDDFARDLPIDPDEPNDWLDRFCTSQGLEQKIFPDWPHGEETTVRNLAAWFTNGRKAAQAA